MRAETRFLFPTTTQPMNNNRKYDDDIPLEVKKRRLAEIIDLQNEIGRAKNQQREGNIVRVLIEGRSKRSEEDLKGRSDENITVIFPKENYEPGQYVDVEVTRSTTTSLIGKVVAKVDLQEGMMV